eukprot:TRINITY_DN340_c0_g1_i1.p1 TRINITY_DN340_c0_g1~~TRINITY_DN340_c0_g1_i1.p1  ORF type:complete len:878 (+),score=321.28 TRINITY_DN340_c0_g1_i1:50-2683(+)
MNALGSGVEPHEPFHSNAHQHGALTSTHQSDTTEPYQDLAKQLQLSEQTIRNLTEQNQVLLQLQASTQATLDEVQKFYHESLDQAALQRRQLEDSRSVHQNEVASLRKALEASRREVISRDEEIERLKNQLREKDDLLRSAHEKAEALEIELSLRPEISPESESDDETEGSKQSEHRPQQIKEEKEEVNEKAVDNDLEALQAEIDSLCEDSQVINREQDTQNSNTNPTQQSSTSESTVRDLESMVDSLRGELREHQEELEQLRQQKVALTETARSFQHSSVSSDELAQALHAQLQQQHSSFQQHQQQQQQAFQQQQNAYKKLQQQLALLEKQLQQQQQQNQQLQQQQQQQISQQQQNQQQTSQQQAPPVQQQQQQISQQVAPQSQGQQGQSSGQGRGQEQRELRELRNNYERVQRQLKEAREEEQKLLGQLQEASSRETLSHKALVAERATNADLQRRLVAAHALISQPQSSHAQTHSHPQTNSNSNPSTSLLQSQSQSQGQPQTQLQNQASSKGSVQSEQERKQQEEQEREKQREREREKEREKEREREKEQEREKQREAERQKEREKEDKEREDREKENKKENNNNNNNSKRERVTDYREAYLRGRSEIAEQSSALSRLQKALEDSLRLNQEEAALFSQERLLLAGDLQQLRMSSAHTSFHLHLLRSRLLRLHAALRPLFTPPLTPLASPRSLPHRLHLDPPAVLSSSSSSSGHDSVNKDNVDGPKDENGLGDFEDEELIRAAQEACASKKRQVEEISRLSLELEKEKERAIKEDRERTSRVKRAVEHLLPTFAAVRQAIFVNPPPNPRSQHPELAARNRVSFGSDVWDKNGDDVDDHDHDHDHEHDHDGSEEESDDGGFDDSRNKHLSDEDLYW